MFLRFDHDLHETRLLLVAGVKVLFNFMTTGIIPWNATPGKACGSTLGDICNTNEVRRACANITHPGSGTQSRVT